MRASSEAEHSEITSSAYKVVSKETKFLKCETIGKTISYKQDKRLSKSRKKTLKVEDVDEFTYVQENKYISLCLSVCMFVCMHACMYMYACMYTCMYACIYVCHSLSQQDVLVSFWTPKPLKITPQDTQTFL